MSAASNNFETLNCEMLRQPGTSFPSVGWTATTLTLGFLPRRNLLLPVTLPHVPSESVTKPRRTSCRPKSRSGSWPSPTLVSGP